MAEQKGNNCYLYLTVFTGNLLAFAAGTSIAWTSSVVPKLAKESNNPLDSPISTEETSWIGSLYAVGGMCGAVSSGYVTNKIGRRKCVIFGGGFVLTICYFILSYSTIITLYYLCRFFIGFSVGVIYTIIPMYNGEVSEIKVRGRLCSTITTFESAGELFSYCTGPYLTVFWICMISCCISGITTILCFFILPESPYYFATKNNYEGAEEVLMKLRLATKEKVKPELDLLKQFVEEGRAIANEAGIFHIFKTKASRKALIIASSLFIFQQLSGIVPLLFYAQRIFDETGSKLPPEICAMTIGVAEFCSSFITPIMVDRFGRKSLLILSAIGMAISEYSIAVYFLLKEQGRNIDSLYWLPVLCLITYVFSYIIGFGPVPWTIMGEIFPAEVKTVAFTISAFIFWAMIFIMSRFFLTIIETFGSAVSFALFATSCVISVGFICTCVIETKGKTFNEIEDALRE